MNWFDKTIIRYGIYFGFIILLPLLLFISGLNIPPIFFKVIALLSALLTFSWFWVMNKAVDVLIEKNSNLGIWIKILLFLLLGVNLIQLIGVFFHKDYPWQVQIISVFLYVPLIILLFLRLRKVIIGRSTFFFLMELCCPFLGMINLTPLVMGDLREQGFMK